METSGLTTIDTCTSRSSPDTSTTVSTSCIPGTSRTPRLISVSMASDEILTSPRPVARTILFLRPLLRKVSHIRYPPIGRQIIARTITIGRKPPYCLVRKTFEKKLVGFGPNAMATKIMPTKSSIMAEINIAARSCIFMELPLSPAALAYSRLFFLLLRGEIHSLNMDIDFHNFTAGHTLNSLLYVLLHFPRYFRDSDTVFNNK